MDLACHCETIVSFSQRTSAVLACCLPVWALFGFAHFSTCRDIMSPR